MDRKQPCLAALLACLTLLLFIPVIAAEVRVGDSKETVLSVMGEPSSVAGIGSKELLYYRNGHVQLVDGLVTEAHLLSDDGLASKRKREEEGLRQYEQMTAETKRQDLLRAIRLNEAAEAQRRSELTEARKRQRKEGRALSAWEEVQLQQRRRTVLPEIAVSQREMGQSHAEAAPPLSFSDTTGEPLQVPVSHGRPKTMGQLPVTLSGGYSGSQYDPRSLANPYGAGSPYKPDGLMNPYSQYGSRYSNKSWNNPYATDAPKLYDGNGNYRGKLSTNPYDPDSVSNPYGRYGSKYSPDSVNNPYGAGNRFAIEPIYVVPSR